MAGQTAVANNGGAAASAVMQAAADARATGAKTRTTRTSIPTQSGKWILGKTIGAGSMGKVKLAKKEDGTEQVCFQPSLRNQAVGDEPCSLTSHVIRLRAKSSREGLPMRTTIPGSTKNEPTNPRKSAQHARLLL